MSQTSRRLRAMSLVILGTSCLLSPAVTGAESSHREPLWPAGAPGAKGQGPDDIPMLEFFPAASATVPGTAVVICPGGGYGGLATGHEGKAIAEWLNRLGIAAVILEYRMGGRGYQHPAPMQDVQRALRTVRARARDLNLNPQQVGVCGFSAGGHLAATAGTHFDSGHPDSPDPIERIECRPDFMILGYPVIAMGEPFTHRGSQRNLLGDSPSNELVRSLSLEKQVRPDTPPTFLFHSTDDRAVPVKNSELFYEALLAAKVSAELHVYPTGGHGYGLGKSDGQETGWSQACENWLRVQGLLPASP